MAVSYWLFVPSATRDNELTSMAVFNDFDNSLYIFLGQLSAGRQTQTLIKKILTHRTSPNTAIPKNRLKMHGFLSEA